MKTQRYVDAFVLVAALLLAVGSQLAAATTNKFAVRDLVQRCLPACQLRGDAAGKTEALVSSTGELLELAAAAQDHPLPTNGVVGYWFSPTMTFLSRQKPKATSAQEAIGVVQLMHALWRGPAFVERKVYEARPFEGGWVIQVEHDFTNYPGSVHAIMPYELLVDDRGSVIQFRERCYYYPGSAAVYTNTVISVYEREIKLDRGRNYPEVLYQESHNAWEKEKEQKATKPERARSK